MIHRLLHLSGSIRAELWAIHPDKCSGIGRWVTATIDVVEVMRHTCALSGPGLESEVRVQFEGGAGSTAQSYVQMDFLDGWMTANIRIAHNVLVREHGVNLPK